MRSVRQSLRVSLSHVVGHGKIRMFKLGTKPMTPAAMDYSSIRDLAEQLASANEQPGVPGKVDLDSLVKKLGGMVRFADGSESLHVDAPGSFVIKLPNMTSARRDRFTIAHELGHYLVHYLYLNRADAASFGRGARNRQETEANVFASALLMPTDQFRRKYREVSGDAWALARYFEVSPAAAEVRSEVLGL